MQSTETRFANVPDDPIARRIRSRRLAAGLSLRELVARASAWLEARGDRPGRKVSVSAPYLSLIENGRKVPDQVVALALAAALEDDPAIYEAWVRTRKRSDLDSAMTATETLRRLLAETEPAPIPLARATSRLARLRVPIVRAGADPGEGLRPACEILAWRRLDASALSEDDHARLDRPFAFLPAIETVRRVADRWPAGEHALVLRAFASLESGRTYAVRHAGGMVLSRVLWNRSQLLLLPAEGASDFLVLEAADETRLRSIILGAVVAVRFEPEDADA